MRTREVSLRIGISGSAGVGKTTLALALSKEFRIPCLHEEMRDYLERCRVPLSGLSRAEVHEVLLGLWRGRAVKERSTPSFVADNCCLDFAAYALYYSCLETESLPETLPTLIQEPVEHLELYDAVFLLPWGVLPYVRDGVRPDNPFDQLRYQLIIEGLLSRYAERQKVYLLPDSCRDVGERRDWVIAMLNETFFEKNIYKEAL